MRVSHFGHCIPPYDARNQDAQWTNRECACQRLSSTRRPEKKIRAHAAAFRGWPVVYLPLAHTGCSTSHSPSPRSAPSKGRQKSVPRPVALSISPSRNSFEMQSRVRRRLVRARDFEHRKIESSMLVKPTPQSSATFPSPPQAPVRRRGR